MSQAVIPAPPSLPRQLGPSLVLILLAGLLPVLPVALSLVPLPDVLLRDWAALLLLGAGTPADALPIGAPLRLLALAPFGWALRGMPNANALLPAVVLFALLAADIDHRLRQVTTGQVTIGWGWRFLLTLLVLATPLLLRGAATDAVLLAVSYGVGLGLRNWFETGSVRAALQIGLILGAGVLADMRVALLLPILLPVLLAASPAVERPLLSLALLPSLAVVAGLALLGIAGTSLIMAPDPAVDLGGALLRLALQAVTTAPLVWIGSRQLWSLRRPAVQATLILAGCLLGAGAFGLIAGRIAYPDAVTAMLAAPTLLILPDLVRSSMDRRRLAAWLLVAVIAGLGWSWWRNPPSASPIGPSERAMGALLAAKDDIRLDPVAAWPVIVARGRGDGLVLPGRSGRQTAWLLTRDPQSGAGPDRLGSDLSPGFERTDPAGYRLAARHGPWLLYQSQPE